MRHNGAFLISIIPGLLIGIRAYAQDCDDLLHHGIYDVHDTQFSDDTVHAYEDWFCSNTHDIQQTTDHSGLDVGVLTPEFAGKLGYDSSSGSFRDWQQQLCTDKKALDNKKQIFRDHLKTINKSVIDAFDACVNASGLHVWLEYRADPSTFVFAAKFVSDGNPANTKLTKFVTAPSSPRVGCDSNPVNARVNGSTRRWLCKRDDIHQAVTVIVEATNDPKGGGGLTLAGFPMPPPPPPPDPGPQVRSHSLEKSTWPNRAIDRAGGQKCGCACGQSRFEFPDSAVGKKGAPIVFRYDISNICRGQSIADYPKLTGHVFWEANGPSDVLPEISGRASVTFRDAGTHSVRFDLTAVCGDIKGNCGCVTGSNTCQATGQIDVIVNDQ